MNAIGPKDAIVSFLDMLPLMLNYEGCLLRVHFSDVSIKVQSDIRLLIHIFSKLFLHELSSSKVFHHFSIYEGHLMEFALFVMETYTYVRDKMLLNLF